MSGGSRVKSFRNIKKNLQKIGISWDAKRGKGSHGCFFGPNQKTQRLHSFPIPKNQQREITIDYVNGIRRHFGLTDKEWDYLFD